MSIGRNEPCPCGSGKKFKKCCGTNNNNSYITTNKAPKIDFSIINKMNMDWPTYSNKTKVETTPFNEFEMTENGLRFIGNREVVYVPEVLNGTTVKAIAPEGFSGSRVQEVYLPPSLEVIGNQAFDQCKSLTKMEFPPSLRKIGRWAFQGCKSLKAVYIYDELEVLDGYAFDECSQLKYVRLPSKIEYIGAFAFSETAIEQIILPSGIQYLGNSIFSGCTQLERIFFQEGLEEIGTMAFANCRSLQAVHFPNSLRVIRTGAFQGCSNLQEVLVQNNIKIVDESAFEGCTIINRFIAPFKIDVEVELFNPISDMPFYDESDLPKRYGYLGSIILSENISQKRFIDWTYMENTQVFTESLLVEANKQYGLEMVLKVSFESDNDISDLEEYEIDLTDEEDVEQTTLTDQYVHLISQGVTCKRLGDIDGAKRKYIEAIKLKPTVSTAYYNLGKILYIQQEFESSVESYKTALELGYDYNETLRHLGHSLLDEENRDGDFAPAIQQYLEGIHPFSSKERILSGKKLDVSRLRMEKYDALCIQAAEEFLR